MAIKAPADSSAQRLRSYRQAASYLFENESSLRHQPRRPVEPRTSCDERKKAKHTPAPLGGAPPHQHHPRPGSPRCRPRTPSPPHPSPSSRGKDSPCNNKAPRSVSPGGTPAASAPAALRQGKATVATARQAPKGRRRVRWAVELVTSAHIRPRTPHEDVPSLYYSRADEKRFRREAEVAPPADEDWGESCPASSLASRALSGMPHPEESKPLWSPLRERRDYAISRAVVVFGDSTRTYCPPAAGGCAAEATFEAGKSFSFDDAAFWNGQLTWS